MVISSVLGLSILGILVNPRGVVMLLRPLNIFSQVNENKFTTELANVFDPLFWQKESYFFLLSLGLAAWLIYKNRKVLIDKFDSFKLQLVGILLLGAFVFLSLSASRNINFLCPINSTNSCFNYSNICTKKSVGNSNNLNLGYYFLYRYCK